MDPFANYPQEMIYQIMLEMPYLDILHFCQSNHSIQHFCESPHLWFSLLQRDFPNIDLTGITEYKWLYETLKQNAYLWLQRNAERLKPFMNKYWLINNPMKTRNLRSAIQNPQLLYWPDYRVAGTASEILQTLNGKGIDQVKFGELYRLSNGAFGSQPGWYRPTEELIRNNSLSYPEHDQLIHEMTTMQSQVKRNLFG
jgi:hypothetical protein